MKLRDILREIEDEEGADQKLLWASYDVGIQPDSIEDALKALGDIKNYGIYAQNMRDPKIITKIFGPSIPAQKAGAAWKEWDSRSDEENNSVFIVSISDKKDMFFNFSFWNWKWSFFTFSKISPMFFSIFSVIAFDFWQS